MLNDQLLECVEPHSQHHDVGVDDGVLDRGGAGELAEFVGQPCGLGCGARSQDHMLPALDETQSDGRADVAHTDDGGSHTSPFGVLEFRLCEAQLTRCASSSISRSTFLPTRKPPVSTATFQVMSQSSRSIVVEADAANIGFPSMFGPQPRNSPERVTGREMSLIARSPSSSKDVPPVRRTPVLMNVITGCVSISK